MLQREKEQMKEAAEGLAKGAAVAVTAPPPPPPTQQMCTQSPQPAKHVVIVEKASPVAVSPGKAESPSIPVSPASSTSSKKTAR